jgi:hypothetical protein
MTSKYEELYEKYREEQKAFEAQLKDKPWIVIRTYVFTLALMDDILFAIEDEMIDEEDIAVLLDKDVSLVRLATSHALDGIEFMTIVRDIVSAEVAAARFQ